MQFKRSGLRILAVGMFAWFLSTTSSFAIDGTPSWLQSQIHVAPANTYVSSPVLAFDHYGVPAISWSLVSTSGGTNTIFLSQRSDMGVWGHRELESSIEAGLRTSLAFDRAERPAVTWINTTGVVKGQFNYGSTQQIGTNGNTNRPIVSLGYDLEGSLRGMFATTSSAGSFSSIGYSANSFATAPLLNVPDAGLLLDAAMVTDHRGLRHIVANEDIGGGQSGDVLVASEMPGGSWVTSRLAAAKAVKGVDIAVDPTDGRVALAYTTYDESPNRSRLYYAKFNGTGLQTTQVLSSVTDSFEDISLAFDLADGRPAIAFERQVASPYSNQLQLAYMNALLAMVDERGGRFCLQGRPRRHAARTLAGLR